MSEAKTSRANRPVNGDPCAGHHPIGPYSAALRRGMIGTSIDGRTTIGRYISDLKAQLIDHCGGSPSITQKLQIERLIKTTLQLAALDEKLGGPNWTDHDSRTHGGLINRQRLLLRDLGMQPAVPASKQRTFHDVAADRKAGRR